MAKVTIKINGLLGGAVHAYKQVGTATEEDLGISTAKETIIAYNIGDKYRFKAEPQFYQSYIKFCADATSTTCVTTPEFSGTITVDEGKLYAYFGVSSIAYMIAAGLAAILLFGKKIFKSR